MDEATQAVSRDLWRCPKCGRFFVNHNQWHSCGPYSVESFLERKSPSAIELFHRFVELVEAFGPVLVAPARTRIGFQVKMIFAAVNRLSDQSLDAHVVLRRRLESPRFRRIEGLSPNSSVHHFRIRTVEEFDEEVQAWLCEGYSVGKAEGA